MCQETIRYKNATIRIHFPERTKEEQTEAIKTATERFLKKAMKKKGEKSNGNKTDLRQ